MKNNFKLKDSPVFVTACIVGGTFLGLVALNDVIFNGGSVYKYVNTIKAQTYLDKKYPYSDFKVDYSGYKRGKSQYVVHDSFNPSDVRHGYYAIAHNKEGDKVTVLFKNENLDIIISDNYISKKLYPVIERKIDQAGIKNDTPIEKRSLKITNIDQLDISALNNLSKISTQIDIGISYKEVKKDVLFKNVYAVANDIEKSNFKSSIYKFDLMPSDDNCSIFMEFDNNYNADVDILWKHSTVFKNEDEFLDKALAYRDAIKKEGFNIKKFNIGVDPKGSSYGLTLKDDESNYNKKEIIEHKLMVKPIGK